MTENEHDTTLSDYVARDSYDSDVARQELDSTAYSENNIAETDTDDKDSGVTSTSVVLDRAKKERESDVIGEWVDDARKLARELGLDPYHVNYWVVDNDEMNELITYGGFQDRYPHWRWGMKFDKQRKKDRYFGGKAFEIVNNDDPAHAFLQMSNSESDQKAVVTHVEAHADFFKNNRWFRDSPNAATMLSRHADRIEEIMSDPDVSRDEVERLIDTVLCIEDTIDQTQTLLEADPLEVEERRSETEDVIATVKDRVDDLDVPESIRDQLFDTDWLEEHDDDDGREFYNDVLGYIMRYGSRFDTETGEAREFEDWESEVIRMLREESYYFAPQKMTKVMNEGHACVAPDTRVVSEDGLVQMRDVVENRMDVSDNETLREVTSSDIVDDYDTVTITTKHGYTLTGSNNHKVRTPDGEWTRLDELSAGDVVEIAGGNDVWADDYEPVTWAEPERSPTVQSVATEAGVSPSTVYEHLNDGHIDEETAARVEDAIESTGWEAHPDNRVLESRSGIVVPEHVDETVGRYLGYQISEGMIASDDASNSNLVQLTNGNETVVEDMVRVMSTSTGRDVKTRVGGSRTHIGLDNASLKELLVEEFGLPVGFSSDERFVPEHIFRSPKSVVAEFLSALFTGDAYVGDEGVIYSTASEDLATDVQELLLNMGIQSNRTAQNDGCWHVHITGESADIFREEIGFVQPSKSEKLDSYVDELEWFETETWDDEVVEIETGTGDVYDITVEETHRYAGGGFVNHNSYWETAMMAWEVFAGDDEFVEYADHHSLVLEAPGLNPYELGRELWMHIENRTNRDEVLDKILRVDGIDPSNLKDVVDFGDVRRLLQHTESFSPAKRNFSLVRPGNEGYLERIDYDDLKELYRYIVDYDRYDSVEEALEDVDYEAGWKRMREIRETHVDVTFIDEFLDKEFVEERGYFTWDYNPKDDQFQVSSTDPADVKRKLLLQFTNFGKPTIVVEDGNYNNRNELLLTHKYNGIPLDVAQAGKVIERLADVWGRPVYLRTIDRDPDGSEVAIEINYKPSEHDEPHVDKIPREDYEYLIPDDIDDYSTVPDDWL